ncbi:MAG: hypothetical protein IT244_04155 [Bacteroidia bacterium]|nr:hypothetical protein [Bacteroidia bacterium]
MMYQCISNYTRFNLWANRTMANWLGSLDEEVLYRNINSSFKSIDLTVQHMLRTQKYWQMFVLEQDTSKMDWSVREHEVGTILKELVSVSEEMKTHFGSFTEAELGKVLQLNSSWAKNSLPRYEYILHVVNHSTFHRGQLVTMARGLGIVDGIPNTDYNMFRCL